MAKLGLAKDNLFVLAAARFEDLVYLGLQDKKLEKKAVAHTRLGSIDQGEAASVEDVSWRAAGMCVVKQPAEKLVVVSGHGPVLTYVGGDSGKEAIAAPVELRGCRAIDGYAHACGMDRQVFVRTGEKKWKPMHAPSAKQGAIAGFESIDGFSRKDLYAVGWEGEIWRCADGAWSQAGKPVGSILTGVCCAGDGQVYACGQDGVLVRGRETRWKVLATGVTDAFWDVRWFAGKLYVATMGALHWLDGDRLAAVDFGRAAPKDCYRLTDAGGVLWSVGQQSVASFDGKAWKRWD